MNNNRALKINKMVERKIKADKKLEISLIIGFALIVLTTAFTSYASSLKNIRENFLRLHILANSDSDEDQEIKYAIRDRVLEFGGDYFYDTDLRYSKQEAKQTLSSNLSSIKQIAEQVVSEYNKEYEIDVLIEEKYFNTRVYEEVTLPAGMYESLVINIGSAQGKNWWCVMFPPMCLPAASESQELSNMLDDNQLKIITGDKVYNIEFAVVEFFEKIAHS